MGSGNVPNGACSGTLPYPCALTDLSNPAFVVPNAGGLLGANTQYVDTFNGALGVRITDYHTLGSSPVQPSYQIDPGGSAAINFMDASDSYFYVSDTGSEIEPFTWNPATMQATRMYVSSFPGTNGMRINYCTAGPEFSYMTPGLMYCPETGAHTSHHVDLYSYDFTSPTPPPGNLVADLGAIPACAPSGVTYDGFVQWVDPFTASADDQTFATALSLTGGQGTGAYVVAWNRNGSCHWWNTTTGETDAGSVTGVTDEFYIHNARLSLDGNWVTVSRQACVSTCANHTVYSWQIGTTNITASGVQNSGHWTVGYNHVVNDSTLPHKQSIQLAPVSSPGSNLCLADCGAANPPQYANWDTHFSWQNANADDSDLIMGSSFTAGTEVPTQAWNNEVMGYDAGGSGTVWRFGRNYITGNKSATFAAEQGIGSVSADGNWFAFASDWNCQLGSNTGGATGTTSPYNCRADVFMLSLTGAGAAPVVSVSPSSLSFGNQYVGSTSQAQTVTLNNTGNAALSISSVTIGPDYTQTNNCGSTVAAGASCSFSVSFAPTTAGPLDEFLQIADSAAGSPQSVALTGSGVALISAVTISPASLAFGNQLVGTTSASQSAVLTSTGNAPLTITSVVPSGGFTLATTATSCPYAGGMVNPGATCTLDVTFTPGATGPVTGAVAITDNAGGSPQSVSLTGTGTGNAVPEIDVPIVPGSSIPGAAGVTLTVNGSGFTPGAVVDWNGSPLATNRVSAQQLTATVPAADLAVAGTASVTVVNPSPGGGPSNVVFFPVTNPTSAIGFGRTDDATGNGPQWVSTGDFNGDGKPDLAVANSIDGTVSILLGNGDGTFSVQPPIGAGPGPVFGTIGDLNGDGISDLAVVNRANNTISILVGTGGGALGAPTSVPTGDSPVALALADFNGDGVLDLAVANNIDDTVSILLGNGNGTFSTSLSPVSVGNGPVSLVAADLNGDGVLDLAVANSVDGTISILFGKGDGTFAAQPVIALAAGVTSVVTADFNGDGLLDLAVANSTTNSISILLGAGGGSFTSAISLSTGNGPSAVAVGDWNGDGIPDLAVANATDSTVEVWLGIGNGTFQAGMTFGTGSSPVSIAAADFNGDGRLDVAVADSGSGTVSVLVQAPQASLSAGNLTFGNQQLGTSSAAQSVTLTNTGTAMLTISSIALAGANSGDFSQSNTCGSNLAAGASCAISVTFTPTATGSRTATASVTDNAGGSPQTVNLSGTGTAAAANLTPGSLSFGNQYVGSTSQAQTVTLNNTGNAALSISSVTIGPDYTQTNNCGSTVAAGASCSFSVSFAPTTTGPLNEFLQIADNATGSPQSVALTGSGVALVSQLTISPASLAFGNQLVGTTSASQSAVLTSTGNAPLTITSIAASGDFSLATTATSCPYAGGMVNPGATCTIDVTFTPGATGPLTGAVAITDNASGSPQSVSLTGTGTGNAVPGIDLPVVPGSAVPGGSGLTLTVNGSGFAPGAVVDWNGNPLATNRVSGEQLTASVPAADIAAAGTASITVVNPPPRGGASNAVLFSVTNPTSTIGFGRTDVATGNGPQWVGTVDFNLDGKPDLAVANSIDGTVSILLGNGDGTFAAQAVMNVGQSPEFAVSADLNGDGIPDLAVADYGSNTVAVLLGTGGGAFSAPASAATGNGPVALALADFNADGAPDLAVANNIDNTISILLGNGDGTFSTSLAPVSVGNGPVSLIAADLNGDGIPDLAVANSLDGTIAILFGNGDGTFAAQPAVTLAPGLTSIITADLNGDGLLDLAAANGTTNSITILLGAGAGSFNFGASLSTGNGPSALSVGDWNGDGIPDLAVANAVDSTLELLLGNGNGTFQTAITFGTGSDPVSIAAADFNNDGRLDAAVADLAAGSISVLLQAPQVNLAPQSLAFGNQQTGTSSTSQSVTLSNTGTAALVISSLAVTGANSGDFSQSNNCGASLAAGGSCSINVTFTPSAAGSRAGAVTVTDNAGDSPESVTLSGTGTAPAVSLTPGSLSFGNQNVGTTSQAQTVVLGNTGTAPLAIASIAVTGANSGDFSQSNNCGSSVAAGSSCNINVTFTPLATGSRSAAITVTDNSAGSPQSASLSGTGTAPAVTLAPSSVAFGNQQVGTSSASQGITLTNTGTASLSISSITITGANSGDFSQSNNCGSSLAAGANCTISVTFTPSATGSRTAAITVTDNASDSPESAALSGTGIAPAVTLTPASLAFGNQQVGTSSASQGVSLTNTGTASLSISSITITGANGGDFSQSNNCGSTVAAGASCTINATFTPATTGSRTASIAVSDNASGNPQMVSLSGTGTAPAVSVMPGSLSYGNQQVGTSSAAQNVTLTNTGAAPLTITAISLSGSNPGDFAQTNTCPLSPSTLAAGSNCAISVTFIPTTSGARSASVSITDNASGSPQTVTLAGTGTQPAVSLSPTSLTFGNQAVGTTSSGKTVTLTNTGTAALTITSIATTGANSGDFSQTNTCGGSVAAGGNCTITVTFAPAATGSRSASLNIGDNAPGSPQTVSLSGTGVAPAVTFSPTSLTFAVQKIGTSSATQKITLTNNGNSALTITSIAVTGGNSGDFSQTNTCPLSPSTLAAGKSCTLTITFKPAAGGTRTASVSVSDNAPGSPQTVPLTGTGTVVQLSPTSLSFGNVKVGKSSTTKAVTLTNLGNTALSITSITITGTNSGDFSQTNTCGTSVGAGRTCSINVTFKPLATGSRSASLSVSDNGGGSPQTVSLSGTGT